MKHTFILKNPAIRSLIFAGTLTFGAVGLSHAETGMTGQAGVHLLAQAASGAEQPPSGWKDPATGQAAVPENNTAGAAQTAPAPAPAAPNQTDSSSGWSSAGQTSGSCQHATPEQESFLCKVVRILYRAETPRGPNRDMDENISAGGAGG
jgi:hypothetical protein